MAAPFAAALRENAVANARYPDLTGALVCVTASTASTVQGRAVVRGVVTVAG